MNIRLLLFVCSFSLSVLPRPHLFMEVTIGDKNSFKIGTQVQDALAISLYASTENNHCTLKVEPVFSYSPTVSDLNNNIAKSLLASNLQKIADRLVNDSVDIKTLQKALLQQRSFLQESIKTETNPQRTEKIKTLLVQLNSILEETQ